MTAAGARAIAVRQEAGIAYLTLNRPDTRNALSSAMVAELRSALDEAQAHSDIRVVVLRGAGGHFCSGGDLNDMAGARSGAPDQQRRVLRDISAAFGHLCGAVARSPLATVAVLEGTVMGGGLGLACAVDIALASTSVSLRLPETSLGVVPAQIAPYLVERVGYSQARRLAVSGGRIDSSTALTLGLVHEVHAPEDIDAALTRVLLGILECAPKAIAATKGLMAQALRQPLSSLVDAAAQVFADAVLGDEGTEGTLAFIQRRKPRWAPQSQGPR